MNKQSKLILPPGVQLNTKDEIDDYSLCKLWGVEDMYGVPPTELYLPLMDADRGKAFEDDYILEILDVMSNPDYFWYTCKYLFNINLAPFQLMILRELWERKFPMFIATRGGGKTFLLAIYALLRAILMQGAKVVIVGAAFRQSKMMFEYMEQCWRSSPILRHIVGDGRHQGPKRDTDRCTFYIGDSQVIAIPIGDGTKIRGLRGHYVLADEFASIPQEVFEVVIKGFSSVSSDPMGRSLSLMTAGVMRSLGLYEAAQEEEDSLGIGNQTVISGTAYYHFNHFFDYWQTYKQIVESQGEQKKLEEIFSGEIPPDFDHTQFSVIRIPWTKLPRGFMDATQISQAKATVHSIIYSMEYEAVFARDSDGFFKRSLLESCVTKVPVGLPSGPVQFHAVLRGSPNIKYIYGIDPASEEDNFAIVILEIHPDHRRIVYCWTITRRDLRERLTGTSQNQKTSFYNFCARKIRDLMKIFPTDHIGMDTQGGGIAIMEALHDETQFEAGKELPMWPYICTGDQDPFPWEKPDKPTDGEFGLHNLHMVQFANADFTRDAHHGLRKDFENKATLFPYFDTAAVGLAIEQDKIMKRSYDTLEDCVMDIEALKDELTTIIHTQTLGGRDKWDTPEIKEPGGKKGRLRKDRCTALVVANMVARCIDLQLSEPQYHFAGGFVGQSRSAGRISGNGPMYVGPDHLTSQMKVGRALIRGV
jgi:hypothetical protein